MQKFNYYPHAIKFFSAAALWGLVNYIPIFAKSLGMSDSQIGILASLFALTMGVSTYFFGRLADKIGRRPLILIGLLFSSVSFFLYLFARDFSSLLVIRILSGIALGIYSSSLTAYAHDVGHKLGKLSSFEGLGVAISSVLMGFLAMYFDITSIFILSAVLFLISFFVSLRLEKVNHIPVSVPLFPHRILKRNLPIYISFFIRHAAATSIWVFWGLYLLQLGANLFWIGVMMGINTLTQFLTMFSVTDRMKVNNLIRLGTLLSAVTFFIYGLATSFWQILPVQIILGASWSFLYVGSIRWIIDNTKEKATGLGLLGSFMNLSQLIGPLAATVLVHFGGYRTIMFVAAVVAFASFLVFDVFTKTHSSFKTN